MNEHAKKILEKRTFRYHEICFIVFAVISVPCRVKIEKIIRTIFPIPLVREVFKTYFSALGMKHVHQRTSESNNNK